VVPEKEGEERKHGPPAISKQGSVHHTCSGGKQENVLRVASPRLGDGIKRDAIGTYALAGRRLSVITLMKSTEVKDHENQKQNSDNPFCYILQSGVDDFYLGTLDKSKKSKGLNHAKDLPIDCHIVIWSKDLARANFTYFQSFIYLLLRNDTFRVYGACTLIIVGVIDTRSADAKALSSAVEILNGFWLKCESEGDINLTANKSVHFEVVELLDITEDNLTLLEGVGSESNLMNILHSISDAALDFLDQHMLWLETVNLLGWSTNYDKQVNMKSVGDSIKKHIQVSYSKTGKPH
jgi:hypothetical protein